MEAKHTAGSVLPKPYEEVFIWYDGTRRVARLAASRDHYQLATFLAETKGQYCVSVSRVTRWAPIVDGNAHDELVAEVASLKESGKKIIKSEMERTQEILQLRGVNADLAKALQKVSALCQNYRFEMVEREAYSILTNIMAEASDALTKTSAT